MKSAKIRQARRPLWRRLSRSDDGSIPVEVGISCAVLLTMMLGVVDFGLAYSRQMAVANAVRAGAQFALVRHPALGPGADQSEALTSMQTIRNAVVDAAPFLDGDPGAEALAVGLACECSDGTAFSCPAGELVVPPCADWQASIVISLSVPHQLLASYPVVGDQVTVSAANRVRLN